MADYKSMYYHLMGQTATSVEILETSNEIMKAATKSIRNIADINAKTISSMVNKANTAIVEIAEDNSKSINDICNILDKTAEKFDNLKEKIKTAHQTTEEIFISGDESEK